MRRTICRVLTFVTLRSVMALLLLIVGVTQSAFAQKPYPDKPVRWLVGYAAGGLPDTVARVVAQRLNERWGQQVLVDNRPSANGILAAELVSKAPPDGYTMLVADGSVLSINPLLHTKLPYSAKDLATVSMIARAPLFLAAHPSAGVNTFKEFIAAAKAKPGVLTYGSSGIGSTHHLSMEYLKSELGIDVVHVPYKGTGQSVPALVGGQVAVVFSAYPSLASYVRAGQLKLLAVNSLKRSALAPDVPTIAELAIPGFDFAPTIGLFAPADTPRDIVAKVSSDIAEIVKTPEMIATLNKLGIEAVGGSPEDYSNVLKSEIQSYAKAVKASGTKAE